MADEREVQNPIELWRQFITDSERQWNGFFREVLGTDQASGAMNAWMETSVTVQRMVADNMMRYFETFNIPTHNDLLALGERMKAIEDTMVRLESAVGSSKKRAAGRTTVARPRPSRTRKPPVTTNGATAT
jgi:hypothetical protein